jgi:hypothetical protein
LPFLRALPLKATTFMVPSFVSFLSLIESLFGFF